MLVVLALAVRFGWTHFPRPVEGGLLILGTAGILATATFFGKARAGRPLFKRTLAFAGTILLVQALMHGAVAAGWLAS